MDYYKFSLKRMSKSGRIRFIITIFTALISNIVIVITPIIQKRLLNGITYGKMETKEVISLCLVSFAGIVSVILEGIILNQLFMMLQRSLQRELLENAIRNENGIIKSKGPGAYMVSVFGDSEHIAGIITTNIFGIVFQCLMAIVILAISLTWDGLFAYIVIPSFVVMIALHIFFDKKYMNCYQEGREYVYEVNPKVLEYIENRRSVLSYASIKEYEGQLYSLFDKRDNCFKKASIVNSLSVSCNSAIKTGSLILFFVFALYKIQANTMEVSTFVALVSYYGIIFQPIASIKALSGNIHKFQTIKNKIKSSLQEDIRYNIPDNFDIRLENCTVEYEGKKCIDNISLCINKKIGLVGPSGEGKTTIIKLLLGELTPMSGLCLYGNVSVSDMPRYILRSEIRYYSQDTEIFDDDIEFNITLGKKRVSREKYTNLLHEQYEIMQELVMCLTEDKRLDKTNINLIQELFFVNHMQLKRKEVYEHIKNELIKLNKESLEKISSLLVSRKYYIEEKYIDLVERLHIEKLEGRKLGQRGGKISGGEKNRVALARFLLPEHGEYFILDEPFTSLDLVSEGECLSVLNDYIKDKKGIIISHKMNIIKSCSEEIFVMEKGNITETGTHEMLLQKNGLYNRLYREYENQQ